MPTLTEIANEVKNTLNQIQTNTLDTASTVGLVKGDTADIKNELNSLIAIDQAGFANLSNGLAVVIEQEKVTNNLLDFNRLQNDTMICWLTTIADLLCRMLHRLNTQVQLQTAIEDEIREVRDILELVHGTETVEVEKQRELQARLDECCPKPQPEPEKCYDPCRTPIFKPYDPRPGDFKPLPQPSTQPVK